VLPIGGLKEKVMAAKLAGVERVVLPGLNRRDLPEVPESIREGIELIFVDHMDEVLELALKPPAPAPDSPTRTASGSAKRRRSNRRAPARPGMPAGG
jgi:ATP-dependent Lon protease